MEKLIHDYRRIMRDFGAVYERRVYADFESSHRIVGIVGPRGIGKTTYLLHYLKRYYAGSSQALYVSADDLYFSNHTLVDLAEQFIDQYDGRVLCIDEIHRYGGWARELKNIFDKYRRLKILFSGSSSIDLIKEKYDLSRRAALRSVPGFSFREYLELRCEDRFPVLTLEQILENKERSYREIAAVPKLLGLFREYLCTGYYPIFLNLHTDRDIFEALGGIIEKVIYTDIASYYRLKTSSLAVLRKILYFVHTSKPGSININRLSHSLRKDHSDVAGYVEMMRDTGLLRFLLIDKAGHALVRNAEKIYLDNTSLSAALEYKTGKKADAGALRELFMVSALENAGLKPFYSPVGDIMCGTSIFEIGGKNKDQRQIKDAKNAYLAVDDVITGGARRIPLYIFGFLY